MSDEYPKNRKCVDKSSKDVLMDMPSVKAMNKDEWHRFLKGSSQNVETQGISNLRETKQGT